MPRPVAPPSPPTDLEPQHILLRPLVTEKSVHQAERRNVYAFQVATDATKQDVRDAVEKMFEVKVVGVRTQNRGGKRRRTKAKYGMTSDWKKAIVEVHEDDRINLY